jgi:hypothetical protein
MALEDLQAVINDQKAALAAKRKALPQPPKKITRGSGVSTTCMGIIAINHRVADTPVFVSPLVPTSRPYFAVKLEFCSCVRRVDFGIIYMTQWLILLLGRADACQGQQCLIVTI